MPITIDAELEKLDEVFRTLDFNKESLATQGISHEICQLQIYLGAIKILANQIEKKLLVNTFDMKPEDDEVILEMIHIMEGKLELQQEIKKEITTDMIPEIDLYCYEGLKLD